MASEKTERATAIAWRWPPESVTTSALTSGMLTPSESRCSRAWRRIEPLLSTWKRVCSRFRNMLWYTDSPGTSARSW